MSEQASKKLQLKEQLERKPFNSLLAGFLNNLSTPIADCQNLDLYFFWQAGVSFSQSEDESKEENIIVGGSVSVDQLSQLQVLLMIAT